MEFDEKECSNCGTVIEEDEKTCSECGQRAIPQESLFEYEEEFDENFD